MSPGARRCPAAAIAVGLVTALAGVGLSPAAAQAATPLINALAGTGTVGAPTNGPATSSKLRGPTGVVVDSNGDLFIADAGNNEVEEVTPTGTLSVFAGTGVAGTPNFSATATTSALRDPQGIAIGPANNVYIADTGNNDVEKVLHGSGGISELAGTGVSGAPTPGGPATSSDLDQPEGVAFQSGVLYIADTGNDDVEEVGAGGKLTLAAGTGTAGAPTVGPATKSALSVPQGLALDSAGDIYIADTGNDDVEEVGTSGALSIVAGTGAAGAPTYGAAATGSALDLPTGVLVDPAGDVVIADSAHQTVDTVNVPGTLSLATSAAPTFSDNLDSGDQTQSYALPLTVQNSGAGADAGWNLTITSTQLHAGGSTLSTGASAVTGVTSTCTSGACTSPTSGIGYPITVPAAATAPTPVKLYQAQTATGIGTFTVTPTVGVSVPQNSYKGTYTSTVTVSVVSGP